ncbi:MAG TPA: hypothetical protein VJ521_01955 [Acidobacteriota bacterium]|nr:hypothetical protein [Acidobacteriota bacterium]
MILFLSQSFLHRLRLVWKPLLKGFLIGNRNLFFFTPDSFVEAEEISAASIDAFLNDTPLPGHWQLLGFLAPTEVPSIPGYLHVYTGGAWNQVEWAAHMSIFEAAGTTLMKVEIRSGQAS